MMKFLSRFLLGDGDSKERVQKVASIADRIEEEMKRIGYWQETPPTEFHPKELYAGVSFEAWLQFVFVPSVRKAVEMRQLRFVPPYRVGVSALRQYDYHSEVPEAHPLMDLCFELESALPPMEELVGPNQPPQTTPVSAPR